MRQVLALVLLVAVAGVAAADELEKGDREVSLRVSYSDIDFGTSQGFDLGASEDTEIAVTYGWLVTDHHEFGFLAGYVSQDIEGGDFFPDSSTDGTSLGGFYAYNFKTGGILTPYVGATISKLGGDLGDAYDFQYGVEIGLKIYPFEHGGLSVGAGYSELRADSEGLADADGLSLGVGLLLKY